VPSLLLDEAVEQPGPLATCFQRSLGDYRPRAREMTAWIAASAGLRDVAPRLRDALTDPDDQTRAFASEALARLDAGRP
jgi:hypothetical protein